VVRRFVVVGALGFVVQLAAFAALTRLGWSWLAATVVAVESAIAHNFLWHRRWTWRERVVSARSPWFADFAKFNAGTAFTSIAGNLIVMTIVLGATHVEPILANVVAVGVMSVANFFLADRWVFDAGASVAKPILVTALVMHLMAPVVTAAPGSAVLVAWDHYVDETEARLGRERHLPALRPAAVVADGRSIDVGSGTISHWRGTIFIPGVSLDRLLDRLQNPGTPPPQPDVVAARVTGRGEDSLSVYMRLVRHAIVTVSYDTEHDMAFRRWSPTLATARSVATRIDEVGGDDHGFLWRLNSYWRYEDRADGVLVSLESLTLSRDVPWLIKPIAGPIASGIARESMIRTLEALKNYMSG
jgi:putative flippase GtrA